MTTTTTLADRLAALERRLAALEARVASVSAENDPAAAAAAAHAAASADATDVSPTQRRLADALYLARAYRAPFAFRRVAPDYYSWPLERRRLALGADSVQRLCKTICLVNTKASAAVVPEGAASEDPLQTRYFFVVTQYCRRFHADRLKSALWKLHADRGQPMAKQHFNMRLCPEDESARLTGFAHNAVTPVGSATPLCVVLSHHLLELPAEQQEAPEEEQAGKVGEWGVGPGNGGGWFWMGGGEVDLKLRVDAREFARVYGAVVLDCTYDEILTPGEEGGDD
jgi:hypothetical protein